MINKATSLNKIKKYAIRIGGGILLLLVLVWIVAYAVITFKKDSIREMAVKQINKQVVGIVTIGDLTPNFIRTFPNISVRLSDVSIRDSLWNVHHHDFLTAEKIYIRLQFFSLLKGKPKIGKVIVENASVKLYTDECGYCNLIPTQRVGFSKGGNADLPDVTFYNTRLSSTNDFLNAYHDIEAEYLNCSITSKDSIYDMHIEMKTLMHSLGFNMAKGSYLKEKSLDGDFHLLYDPKNKITLDHIVLDIDDQPFTIDGNFLLHTEPKSYNLDISTENVNYKKASGLLTQALRQKLDSFDIVQPINASVHLVGVMEYKAKPIVNVQFHVNDADMTTTFGDLSHCTFNGSFSNQVDSLEMTGDINSKFIFNNISAEWGGIPITSTLIEVENLLTPNLKCHIQSIFELQNLNSLAESSTINFIKGKGILDINYNGTISNIDTLYPSISGTFSLTDADLKYIPRDLLFQNCNGSMEFNDEDVIINNLSAKAGNTDLEMTGKITNMMALLYDELAQPIMEWNISTPDLNLNDFLSYVRPQAKIEPVKKTNKNKVINAAENLDRFLRDGTAQLNVKAGRLAYKKFVATNVLASIKLVENKVMFDDVALAHAGGKAYLKGSLINGAQSNQLTLNSTIDHVNIPGIFQAFDNFGQDAVTYQNMKGQLSAKINMTGVITDKATVAENTMKGSVDFSIKNGELVNFEPAMKIAATAFKNRDFSHIQFGELKNRLEINGSAILINKMEIRSNVVVLFAEGMYDTKKGTDMSLQVPLSNLSKEENDINNTGKVGLAIRLRAKTGDDGKLAISWDPFNNAAKERAEFKSDSDKETADGKEKSGKNKK